GRAAVVRPFPQVESHLRPSRPGERHHPPSRDELLHCKGIREYECTTESSSGYGGPPPPVADSARGQLGTHAATEPRQRLSTRTVTGPRLTLSRCTLGNPA